MSPKRWRFPAARQAAPLSPLPRLRTPGRAVRLELARQRAWAEFASELLDTRFFGNRRGDIEAADALACALAGRDWPPAWRRDPDDPAVIAVDPADWARTSSLTLEERRIRTTGRSPQPRRLSVHLCHPWSGDCAMRGLRINLNTPWAFVTIGLFGGQVQKRRRDGTYGDEWTRLSIEPPIDRLIRPRTAVGR